MFDPTLRTCQQCTAGIAYMKQRINEESLKKACKFICSKTKKQEIDDQTPDLFAMPSKPNTISQEESD